MIRPSDGQGNVNVRTIDGAEALTRERGCKIIIANSVDSTTEVDGSTGSGDDSGSLHFTGAPSPELLVTGLALLATGAAVLALARRTRTV